jgi:hypothetical protein
MRRLLMTDLGAPKRRAAGEMPPASTTSTNVRNASIFIPRSSIRNTAKQKMTLPQQCGDWQMFVEEFLRR